MPTRLLHVRLGSVRGEPGAQTTQTNLGLVIGDSASQALAEFLSVFLAVVVWRAKLAQEGFAFQVRSDSTAALSATDKLAGKSVVTNFVAAELALRLEVMGVRVVDVLHVPGVLKKTADWLSRRAEPGKSGDSELDCLKGCEAQTRAKLGQQPLRASVCPLQEARICGTVPAEEFVSRVRPRALVA